MPTVSGGTGIEVEGLRELRRSLGRADRKGLDASLRQAHKKVAKDVEGDVRGAGGSAQQAKAIKAILGQGTPEAAVIAIRNTAAVPFGVGAFMGAKRWPQFPAWVGNDWNIEAGVGPYVVAPTIADDLDRIREVYLTDIADLLAAAGLAID